MTEKKLTYAEALDTAIKVMPDGEVKEKLLALKASITKKNTERKPTANQVQNEKLADVLYDFLCDNPNRLFTVSEICKECEEFAKAEISTSKATAILKILITNNKAENVKEKRRSFYRVKAEN